ncbi:5'-methylthioadenosine/S-adenosylhomocysteine nucleosidase [candidate division WOR-3 bacterium 4484_100]|uniref:adenosylhomocysteine nucleosidase n=1 Tax=candidate division WOR-3 bacterium 4484_100 TaxID=1936077 RepID=A0A1V4QGF5_UNCW3|nr:MAG: 5'-methylthioadenosine/S-adenosylhomocysteine nucleosidase [candidate division WOR-3 bacterium 4484_100]
MTFLLCLFLILPFHRIGIMGAMDKELNLIKQKMKIEEVDTLAQKIFTVGSIKGIPCVCVQAGVGKVNAALTAEILILKYQVDAIIFSGVAGGINPQLKIGDIVISERVLHHDFGQILPDQFIPGDTTGYSADTVLIEIALKAVKDVKFPEVPKKLCKEKEHLPRVVLGRIVSGDQFISSEKKRQWLAQTFRADCVEMEGSGMAQVCALNKLPFLIIRCVSDLANEKAEIDFPAFVGYSAENSSLLLLKMIELLGE